LQKSERREACERFNRIEKVLTEETLGSFQTPDFWENLALLERIVKFRNEFCPEGDRE
jgi:hypothetical protein